MSCSRLFPLAMLLLTGCEVSAGANGGGLHFGFADDDVPDVDQTPTREMSGSFELDGDRFEWEGIGHYWMDVAYCSGGLSDPDAELHRYLSMQLCDTYGPFPEVGEWFQVPPPTFWEAVGVVSGPGIEVGELSAPEAGDLRLLEPEARLAWHDPDVGMLLELRGGWRCPLVMTEDDVVEDVCTPAGEGLVQLDRVPPDDLPGPDLVTPW